MAPTEPLRAPGRPKTDDVVSSDEILGAALRAFARDGYAGVSMRQLNKEIGVSHSLISQRFGSKQQLWYAAIDYAFGRQAAAVVAFDPTVSDPLEHLRGVIVRFLGFCAKNPDLLGLMNIEGALESERLDYIYERYVRPTLEPVDHLLRHLVAEGRVRPVTIRQLFLLIAHGGAAPFTLVPLARRLDRSDPLSPRKVKQHIELVTGIVIEGIRLH